MAEAAGVALAMFPLVVKGISAYVQCRNIWQWRVAMASVLRELEMENNLFLNTCTNVLHGTCEPERVVKLLGGDGWDEDFIQHLQYHWGEANAKVFVDAMRRMGVILTAVKDELGFDHGELSVDSDKRSRKNKRKQIWVVLQQVDCLAEIKTLNCQLERLSPQLRVSKVRFSKQSPMAAEHSRARKLAVNLHEVFQANLQDISSCACNTPHNVSLRLPRVREPATESSATPIPIRFEVLFPLDSKLPDAGTSWRGLEFQPLTAMPSSPVSPRNSTVAASRDDATDQKAGATRRKMVEGLRGLFGTKSSGSRTPTSSTPCTPSPTSSPAPHHSPATPTDIARGATVRFATDPSFVAAVPSESVMLSSDYSNAESIGNLCYAIQKAGSRKPGAASASVLVGALLGKENIRWNCLQPTMSFPFETIRAVPLDAVLLTGALKLDVKLRLGVQIALAMMQLHTTQWLGDDWGTKDIFILHRAATRQQVGSNQHVEIWEPILEHAFVHCTFDGQPRRLSVAESVADYNRSLFSLGVVLIELALGKPIEKLRGRVTVDCGGNALESCADPVRTTAVDCLGRVYSSQALAYGDAVERCINGLRLAEPIPKDLNDPRYKNEVQVEIVSALERNLAVYLGHQA